MILQRELKNHLFAFDTDTRMFSIYERNSEGVFGHKIHLPFVQTFSFVRFFVSCCQKGFWRKKKYESRR